jgi:hypothetical protein
MGLSFAALLIALSLGAQTPRAIGTWDTLKSLAPGTEILASRFSQGDLRGLIQSVTDDAIVINTSKSQETVARTMVVRVAIRRKGHRLRNTFIGLGVGTGTGLAIGGIQNATCKTFLCGIGSAVWPPLGAIAGTIVGAIIPTGGWREVYHT